MKPDRGFRRNSVACVLSGVSMMRSPIGSTSASAPSSVRNIPFWAFVFGTVALSTTLIQGVAGIAVKYFAARLIFSFVIAFANPVINSLLGVLCSEGLLGPLRDVIIFCTKYSLVRPGVLGFV